MRRLLLATRNPGKVAELQALLRELDVTVVGLDSFPDLPELPEEGDTLTANALQKARTARQLTGLPALADDSGLWVDALDGAPGVCSAQYGGPGLDDAGRCDYLLARLQALGCSHSRACFQAVVACVSAAGEHCTGGLWPGIVRGPAAGSRGFGYDPLFRLLDRDATAAMLEPAEKSRLSHRGQAVRAMTAWLRAHPEWLLA
ncbi:MAG: hypothetical protein IT204_01800 [Fimbriimonadaceae bacterium]|nr:hypothetical protein [Fimbriimonadaceae bacterium]